MKTISLINKKGGVGKTTITINLAYLFAESCDLRVLVVDNDDQGNATQFFGARAESGLADVLTGADIRACLSKTRYSLIDLLPSDERLLEANMAVIKDETIVQQSILKDALQSIDEMYDICLIDNPPSINASVINALVASDEVIIVTTPDMYGLRGVEQMMTYIKLRKDIPLFRSRIRYTKDKPEAAAEEQQAIFEYSPNCGFSCDLVKFLRELMEGM